MASGMPSPSVLATRVSKMGTIMKHLILLGGCCPIGCAGDAVPKNDWTNGQRGLGKALCPRGLESLKLQTISNISNVVQFPETVESKTTFKSLLCNCSNGLILPSFQTTRVQIISSFCFTFFLCSETLEWENMFMLRFSFSSTLWSDSFHKLNFTKHPLLCHTYRGCRSMENHCQRQWKGQPVQNLSLFHFSMTFWKPLFPWCHQDLAWANHGRYPAAI